MAYRPAPGTRRPNRRPSGTTTPRRRAVIPVAVDTLGVEIVVGDRVRVTGWGAPVRLADVGRAADVVGFTRAGNVVLSDAHTAYDPIARGRAVSPGMLGVLRRDGAFDGYEGNVDLHAGGA